MVKCELCGRLFKTPQGLRGHKTFVHGIRADQGKIVALLDRFGLADEAKSELEADNPRLVESEEKLRNIVDKVAKIEDTNVELKNTLEKLENYMALLATRNETYHLASSLKLIKEQVEKHDRWLNPRGIHEAIVDLDGGPIASIEKRLHGHQSFTN